MLLGTYFIPIVTWECGIKGLIISVTICIIGWDKFREKEETALKFLPMYKRILILCAKIFLYFIVIITLVHFFKGGFIYG